jgi:hypothetical protein
VFLSPLSPALGFHEFCGRVLAFPLGGEVGLELLDLDLDATLVAHGSVGDEGQ